MYDFRTIDVATGLADRDHRAELILVYVVEVPQQYPLDADLPDQIERGETILRDAEHHAHAQRGQIWSRVTTTLLQARLAAAAIVDEAIERGADAIVLGAVNTRRHGQLTQGETVPYVLDNAPCDVIVLRVAGEVGDLL